MKSKILVTGSAGFIGLHVCNRLLGDGHEVTGIDNLSDYYDPTLKLARLDQLHGRKGFRFEKLDLAERDELEDLFENTSFDIVIHLAAQAGVRPSIDHPGVYVQSNLVGFGNLLEACRHGDVGHLIFASSSSVYGANKDTPFSTSMNVDHPISLYAATKKANELMAHSYAHLYGLPVTGLRFFTVYGPWGRPDMAYFLFTRAILDGKPIKVFNGGNLFRDFTYIDDIVESMMRLLLRVPEGDSGWDGKSPDPSTSPAPYRLYNIGNENPIKLSEFIEILERRIGKKAIREGYPMQPGDMEITYADTEPLRRLTNYIPVTPIEDGLRNFVAWYREFYGA